jgi:hypothetical protein
VGWFLVVCINLYPVTGTDEYPISNKEFQMMKKKIQIKNRQRDKKNCKGGLCVCPDSLAVYYG